VAEKVCFSAASAASKTLSVSLNTEIKRMRLAYGAYLGIQDNNNKIGI